MNAEGGDKKTESIKEAKGAGGISPVSICTHSRKQTSPNKIKEHSTFRFALTSDEKKKTPTRLKNEYIEKIDLIWKGKICGGSMTRGALFVKG